MGFTEQYQRYVKKSATRWIIVSGVIIAIAAGAIIWVAML